jgi:hypothetical protein
MRQGKTYLYKLCKWKQTYPSNFWNKKIIYTPYTREASLCTRLPARWTVGLWYVLLSFFSWWHALFSECTGATATLLYDRVFCSGGPPPTGRWVLAFSVDGVSTLSCKCEEKMPPAIHVSVSRFMGSYRPGVAATTGYTESTLIYI